MGKEEKPEATARDKAFTPISYQSLLECVLDLCVQKADRTARWPLSSLFSDHSGPACFSSQDILVSRSHSRPQAPTAKGTHCPWYLYAPPFQGTLCSSYQPQPTCYLAHVKNGAVFRVSSPGMELLSVFGCLFLLLFSKASGSRALGHRYNMVRKTK